MTDESFTSLFTFAAIELISQLNLISSYSLIHMAKLRSVRVAITFQSIKSQKMTKFQIHRFCNISILRALHALTTHLSPCNMLFDVWLPF